LTARVISNTPKDNIPEPTQLFNNTTPKRKTPKRQVKKINITYRTSNRRKPIIRSFKPARDTSADNGISKNIGEFSNNDEIKDKKAYLCGPGISKGYIDTINTVIGCDLKVTMAFMRDML
jgi:hypothetical protein